MIRFLVIRLSSIGDIVLTSPVLRHLKKIDGAEVHFFTKATYEEVIKHNPYIDQYHLFSGDLKKNIQDFKAIGFDYVIDLHHNIRTYRIKTALKVPALSFNKLNREKWLRVHLKMKHILPEVHIVDRYMDTIRFFDFERDNAGLEYFIGEEDKVDVKTVLGNDFSGKYVAIVLGAKHYTKQIPYEKLVQLIEHLEMPLVLLGGDDAEKMGQQLNEHFPKKILIDATGRFRLNETASLIQQAEVVITPDTGLMHIAAAYKRKIISLWGNTIPEFGMMPYQAHSDSRVFEITGLKCRPCSKIGYDRCPKKHFACMMRQDMTQVAEYVKQIF